MSEKKTSLITIGDKEYDFNELTQEQQGLFSHCLDLDRKISNTAFQLEQLNVGKTAFFSLLQDALSKVVEVPPPDTVLETA
jgi:hypothetical protein